LVVHSFKQHVMVRKGAGQTEAAVVGVGQGCGCQQEQMPLAGQFWDLSWFPDNSFAATF
jgi:hypothetical protein